MLAAPTKGLLLSALVLGLAGGCATARPEVAQQAKRSCIRRSGQRFNADVCLLRLHAPGSRASKAPPEIWVALFSWDASVADLGLWQVTVVRDGRVVSHGHFLNVPAGACQSSGLLDQRGGAGFCSDGSIRLSGMKWHPGTYQVKLAWTPDPAQHFEFHVEVPTGYGAPGPGQPLPRGLMLVSA